ncbi:MAG: hypothetical protein MJ197_04290 [Bacteroidales bacterium]|nr:hypothetical protein [Bacteroidales bacterium]
MKNFRKMFLCAVICATAFVLSSCQSKEENVISQMEKIEKMISSEDFQVDKLDEIEKQYDAIMTASKECNFSDEQRKQLVEIQGRIAAGMTKQMIKGAGSILNDAIDASQGFMKGFTDVISEEIEKATKE